MAELRKFYRFRHSASIVNQNYAYCTPTSGGIWEIFCKK
ncbi:hypothetical protein MHH_c13310 [Mannheimia haemolytica M42548]|nr:hypothetical protein MHH_c13310 [Mannheimia haemolytica M42548]